MMRPRMRHKKLMALALGAAAVLSACGGSNTKASGGGGGGEVTVNWWTWDPNQAAAYSQCIAPFEAKNPGIKVKISQYNVSDYFTKLTAGFVAGNAPDAFMNSVTYLQSYASQHQLEPLDKFISSSHLNLDQYSIGAPAWKYKDGKQYALPMDWSTATIYYNKADVAAAGYTPKELDNLTWNPENGGSFLKLIKHLTVDKDGVRGDQPGFNPKTVKTYGIGNIEQTGDPFGQNTWGALLASVGINIPNRDNWPTQFNYANPEFVKAISAVKALSTDGYSPGYSQFTTGESQQLATGDVAMVLDGNWEATTYAALPHIKVGIAPMVAGSNGQRHLITNSNGNNMWAGTKHPTQTWKWMSYQESQACQTKAADFNGSFFPSIAASLDSLAKTEEAKGIDFSVFADYVKKNELFPSPVYNNGATLTNDFVPMLEAFFTGKSSASIFPKMQAESKTLLAKQ